MVINPSFNQLPKCAWPERGRGNPTQTQVLKKQISAALVMPGEGGEWQFWGVWLQWRRGADGTPLLAPAACSFLPWRRRRVCSAGGHTDGGAAKGTLPPALGCKCCKRLLTAPAFGAGNGPYGGCSRLCPMGWGICGGISGEHLWPLGPASLACVPLCHAKMAVFPSFRSSDMEGPCWGARFGLSKF